MPTKTAPRTNGSSTQFEQPISIDGGNMPSAIIADARLNESSETQWEQVGALNFNIKDRDASVSNPGSEAAESSAADTEAGFAGLESGSESAFESGLALDAIYGSYPDLLNQVATEVILGADNRVRINPTTSYPWRAICALKITAANGGQYIGTGWLVSPRTVITAGHCLYMHAAGGWVKSVQVIPAENDAARPYGTFTGTSFRSTAGWVNSQNRENDYGAIILPSNQRPGATVGTFGLAVRDDNFLKTAALNLSGYPGDKGGHQQWFMAQQPSGLSARVITYQIDTMGGQSGSPVWVLQNGQRYGVGIHTNGHTSGNSATRIEQNVYNNLVAWKNLGL